MMLMLAIRKADGADLRGVVTLERACDGAPHWSEAIWSALLEEGSPGPTGRVALVAVMLDEMVGFAVVGVVGEVAELESVVVAAAQRAQGIGKALCRRGMAWAHEQGALTMELEVRASNAAASAMYRSLGFVEQGRRARYYRDPDEDALLMTVGLQVDC